MLEYQMQKVDFNYPLTYCPTLSMQIDLDIL